MRPITGVSLQTFTIHTMSSHTEETPTAATDPVRKTDWPYTIEWLIIAKVHITFTKVEGSQRVTRIGKIKNFDYSGDKLTLQVPQCAFRIVGDETLGDQMSPDGEQIIEVMMSSTPVSISEQGRVSFESDGVRYQITPDRLSPMTASILAELFG